MKKAYPLVVDKIEDLVYKLGDRVGEIKDYQTEVENKKQILVNNTARVKSDMASVFADLRQQLDKKEKQLMEKADQFLKENLNEFETYLRSAQSKVIALSKLIDSVNSNYIRKDEVNLVNFYSDNNKKIRYLAEEKIEEVPDLNSILSLDVAINKDSLEEMLDNFRGITVELAAQKGIEVNKIQKPLMATMNRERYGIKKEGTTYIDDFNR